MYVTTRFTFYNWIRIVKILQKAVFTTDLGQEQKEAAVFAGYSFALNPLTPEGF